MGAGQVVLRLLEAVCAVVAMLFALLLVLATDYETLRAAYHNGALTGVVIVFVVVCIAWLVLWRKRTGRRVSAWLVVALLACGACALVLVAVVRGAALSTNHEPHIEPATTGTPPPPAPPPAAT
ncbi:hypothetical protein [Streptomyces montanisoli]|uniref:Uncharacterized protein n=1 Tax=Streptomyces montanisoli TaxID=2798581 RepID=A0A940MFY9_9ACTN|nr:hypothetical protein [Streptomyces montanisoli]MBP0460168.1 hypothetical protein [Streptomyces montanisoli]